LAALIVALRPRVVVELGVWMGGSAIPMALALQAVGAGQLVAIDAWSAEVSVEGQEAEIHRTWWEARGESGHLRALETFLARLRKHGISPVQCKVRRQRTDEAFVPPVIDLLHHDANHGPQVVDDIERWTPAIRIGGMLVLDDLDWAGGHVLRARDRAVELGFVELYSLGTGCVMQRVGGSP
jgi:predicted O-methyltransferase YrrM